MIYLDLFLSFLKIGGLSFGGGYGMISIIRETVMARGWLAEEELLNFIAVAESTPGPIAINMATFIGSSQAGILGSLVATLGVVLPSFVIILVIAAVISNLLKNKIVNAFLAGVRPCIVGMIVATAVTIGMSTLFSFKTIEDSIAVDISGILIFCVLMGVHIIMKKLRKRKPSPILMILLSAAMGIVFYG